jgi:hypothetical protein
MAQTPEGKVKAKLKKMFAEFEPELYYFMPVQSGFGAAGLDFHCCYKGMAFFVETKARGNWPTPRQRLTMRRIQQSGAPTYVIRDEEGIDRLRQDLLQLCTQHASLDTPLWPALSFE